MKRMFTAVYNHFNMTLVSDDPARFSADGYPDKPIRFIVPFAEGGPGDILARLIGRKLTESWGQPVIVENHPGAGGTIGSAIGARSAADGYTLILAASTHAINPSLYATLPYDTVKDFQPVTLMISMPNILVVNPSVPVDSVADLVAFARSHPGQLKYASGGAGTPSHLGAELLKTMTGVDIVHVQFSGHATAGAALVKGEVSMMFDAILLALPEVKVGKVKALGVTSAKRSAVAHEVPTIAESGLPEFDFSPGVGVLVRAGIPKAILNKIYKEIVRILGLPDVREQLACDGAEIIGSTPEEFSAYIDQEIAKWAKVVKAAGISA
ncbi:MAG: tripartite tricarboxylate transporter substrate binding protein [Betaproteobacteria bacterium]|nr:tripartite tricarboxylate transporter substrate binding protein [Betaproteobacteria bacterium]MBI3052648.1 tripartite tricarboxylate transporter substrate binding protein [Betaproteobacteria bacterium]